MRLFCLQLNLVLSRFFNIFFLQLFKRVSLAYKRLQQPANCDWVQQSHLMEQFSTVFRCEFFMMIDRNLITKLVYE